MKLLIKNSILISIFLVLTSFVVTVSTFTKRSDFNQPKTSLSKSADNVAITYDRSDVCGLKCIAEVRVAEKWWIYNNSDQKRKQKKV
jgi:hypothetical protein